MGTGWEPGPRLILIRVWEGQPQPRTQPAIRAEKIGVNFERALGGRKAYLTRVADRGPINLNRSRLSDSVLGVAEARPTAQQPRVAPSPYKIREQGPGRGEV